MVKIKWKSFCIKSQKGNEVPVDFSEYNEKNEATMLLAEISRMPKIGRGVTLQEAYDAMITIAGALTFELPGDGNGEEAAAFFNQGFVASATILGMHIELTGDEYEVLNLAS